MGGSHERYIILHQTEHGAPRRTIRHAQSDERVARKPMFEFDQVLRESESSTQKVKNSEKRYIALKVLHLLRNENAPDASEAWHLPLKIMTKYQTGKDHHPSSPISRVPCE